MRMSSSDPMLRIYLARMKYSIPELPTTVDSNEKFCSEIKKATLALADFGRILGETDFGYLGAATNERLQEVVRLLKGAPGRGLQDEQ